jgi:hypothetical protein
VRQTVVFAVPRVRETLRDRSWTGRWTEQPVGGRMIRSNAVENHGSRSGGTDSHGWQKARYALRGRFEQSLNGALAQRANYFFLSMNRCLERGHSCPLGTSKRCKPTGMSALQSLSGSRSPCAISESWRLLQFKGARRANSSAWSLLGGEGERFFQLKMCA